MPALFLRKPRQQSTVLIVVGGVQDCINNLIRRYTRYHKVSGALIKIAWRCVISSVLMEMETGEWALLSAHLPGLAPRPVGILLGDSTDKLYLRMRSEWWSIAPDKDEIEIWRQVADELEEKGRELGAAQVLDWLENSASHVLQIGGREEVQFLNIPVTLDSLYNQHVTTRTDQENFQYEQPPILCDIKNARDRALRLTGPQRPFPNDYRVYAAVAAALFLAAFLVTRWGSVTTRPHLKPSATTHHSNLSVISQLPDQRLMLRIDPVPRSVPALHRVLRKRRIAAPSHKRFQLGRVTVHPVPFQSVEISPPPPLYVAVEMSSPELPYFAFQEVPAFREHRHRIIQFLSVLATPFKSLFSSSRGVAPTALD